MTMSQRMTMDEVLRQYGVPQIKLDIHATRSELLKLREKLMAIRDLSQGKEQGYLDIDCKLYIDGHGRRDGGCYRPLGDLGDGRDRLCR